MPPDDDAIREQLRRRVRDGDSGAYEQLYAHAGFDSARVPWADLAPNPNLTAWLDREQVRGDGMAALVVGCGLGDDAEELHRRGFDVTAFDISPTAIAWSRRRFPASAVRYTVADLLQAPPEFAGSFKFVLEAYTLQAMPPTLRAAGLGTIPHFVAPGGSLLIICRGRDETDPAGDLPYPLTRRELDGVHEHGLTIAGFDDYIDQSRDPAVRRFRAWYRR